MLPKNNLRNDRMKRLLIFPDADHPYEQNIFKDYENQE
jgi:large subunit ribosomal protein L13